MKRHSKIILGFFAAFMLITLVSCDPSKKYEEREKLSIQNYLDMNPNLNFELKPSGLYYLNLVVGTGPSPVVNDSAFIKYTVKFIDGTIYSTNVGTTSVFGFIVGNNISGFDEAIQLMRQGGKAIFLIPSSLAYGPAGSYYDGIPGFTPLLFDVELTKVLTP
jgi:FKBP-type peptidyl-prolyl cis-trans isomerase FkpA